MRAMRFRAGDSRLATVPARAMRLRAGRGFARDEADTDDGSMPAEDSLATGRRGRKFLRPIRCEKERATMPRAVIFDVDGTLVDTVDLHAASWVEAFRHFGREVGFHEVRA